LLLKAAYLSYYEPCLTVAFLHILSPIRHTHLAGPPSFASAPWQDSCNDLWHRHDHATNSVGISLLPDWEGKRTDGRLNEMQLYVWKGNE